MFNNIKTKLVNAFRKIRLIWSFLASRNKPRTIYMMGHGRHFPNLGDQAQAAAIPIWIAKHFIGPVIQVKTYEVLNNLDIVAKLIKPDDVVFIHSGGCFGDDWYETQQIRERVFEKLANHKIIQLPQTIHYSDTDAGRNRLANSQKIIGNVKNIFLIGRDPVSALFAKNNFHTAKVSAYPDMVLALQNIVVDKIDIKNYKSEDKQKKCLLILRNDKEGVLNSNSKNALLTKVRDGGFHAYIWDTDVEEDFKENEKLNILMRYLKYIASYDAIITDRFHGLIFSVLTYRPTLVLPTHNHKLTSALSWFDKVNFVRLLNDGEDLCESLEIVLNIPNRSAPDWNREYFDPMAEEIRNFIN